MGVAVRTFREVILSDPNGSSRKAIVTYLQETKTLNLEFKSCRYDVSNKDYNYDDWKFLSFVANWIVCHPNGPREGESDE